MHIENLGRLEGRVLLFGGPYSNLQATRAMMAEAQKLGVPASRVICSGDLVAYCGEPVETVDLIREWGISVVMGNCEESLGSDADDCDCGFDENSACSLLSVKWYEYANTLIGAEQRQWMAGLPGAIRFEYAGFGCQVIHGGVSAINQFIFESDSLVEKSRQIRQSRADIIIAGHAGIPFGQKVAAGYWLNAGVIGMPANDGTADTWYLLIDSNENGVAASWHRLEYDAATSRRSTQSAGMTEYAQALVDGLWPAQDSLPCWEKQQRGRPLQIPPLVLL